MPASLTTLPSELLLSISDHLSDPVDLKAFLSTSRRHYSLLASTFATRFPTPIPALTAALHNHTRLTIALTRGHTLHAHAALHIAKRRCNRELAARLRSLQKEDVGFPDCCGEFNALLEECVEVLRLWAAEDGPKCRCYALGKPILMIVWGCNGCQMGKRQRFWRLHMSICTE